MNKTFAESMVIFLFLVIVVLSGCVLKPAETSPLVSEENVSELVTEEVSEVDEEYIPESRPLEQIVEEKQQAPTISVPTVTQSPPPLPASPITQPSPAPMLIDGKTLSERLAEAYERLHTRGSAEHIHKSFPDIKLVYTDDAMGMPFPREIIPFRYYYSREANTTFNICAIELTVFICKGKLDHLIQREDVDSGRCEMTPIYGDPRL